MSHRPLSHHRVADRHGYAAEGDQDGPYQHPDSAHYIDQLDDHYDHRQAEPAPAQAAYAADSVDPRYPVDNPVPRRRRKPAPKPPAVTPKGYTLGHAGRQIRIGPVAFWICVGSLVIMAGWSAVTATYFAFHDEVLARLISRQAAMQFAYEDRIAEMRAQVDRVTSRQLARTSAIKA